MDFIHTSHLIHTFIRLCLIALNCTHFSTKYLSVQCALNNNYDRATLRLYYENKGESENINLNNEDLCDTVNSSSLLEMLASFSASD